MQWVHDCVQAGYCLDEDDYDMGGRQAGAKKAKENGSNSNATLNWAKELDLFVLPTSHSDHSFIDGCKVGICADYDSIIMSVFSLGLFSMVLGHAIVLKSLSVLYVSEVEGGI